VTLFSINHDRDKIWHIFSTLVAAEAACLLKAFTAGKQCLRQPEYTETRIKSMFLAMHNIYLLWCAGCI
jgi:hypothetical protein